MHPHHRAELAAAVARFLANIRRLARAKLRSERDRFLATIDPSRAQPTGTTSTRPPAVGRPKAPARRARAVTAEPSRRSATAARRTRKPDVAVKATQPEATRASATRPPAKAAATVPPRRGRAPAAVQGTRTNAAAVETTPATTATSAGLTRAAPVSAAPTIAAPVSAAPTIETSPGSAIATPATAASSHAAQAPQSRNHEDRHETARCRGIVKWFSDAKGYGFIRGDDGRDVFVHNSAIASSGFRTLVQGQAVEYDVQQSAKGLHAVSVTHPGVSPTSSARPAGAGGSFAPRP
jgi:CspA family cold shock protein